MAMSRTMHLVAAGMQSLSDFTQAAWDFRCRIEFSQNKSRLPTPDISETAITARIRATTILGTQTCISVVV
jgi:hypothetical protein